MIHPSILLDPARKSPVPAADKWAERFARLEAMLLAKSFAVPVEAVVKPAEVITSQKPFFDPGASTSNMAENAESSGPSLVQATGDAVVQARGDESQQIATQPVEAPGVQTATQPVQAPSAGPDVLLSGTGDAALSVDQTLTGGRTVQSTSGSGVRMDSTVSQAPLWKATSGMAPQTETSPETSLQIKNSQEASYRETIRGMRSFMGWHKVLEFESVSSADDNPFAGSRVQPTGKVSVKLLVDDLLCKKMEKLNLTITDVAFLLPHPPGPLARTCSGVGREQPENKLPCAIRLLDCPDA